MRRSVIAAPDAEPELAAAGPFAGAQCQRHGRGGDALAGQPAGSLSVGEAGDQAQPHGGRRRLGLAIEAGEGRGGCGERAE